VLAADVLDPVGEVSRRTAPQAAEDLDKGVEHAGLSAGVPSYQYSYVAGLC
jgi:hypothetical protein